MWERHTSIIKIVIRDIQVSEGTFGVALECPTELHEVVPKRKRGRSKKWVQPTCRVTVNCLPYGLKPQFLSTSFFRARDTFRTKLSSSNSSRNWQEHSNYSGVHTHQPMLELTIFPSRSTTPSKNSLCRSVLSTGSSSLCVWGGGVGVCVCVWREGRVSSEDVQNSTSCIALGLTELRGGQSQPAAGP